MLQNVSSAELWAGLNPHPFAENPYLTEMVDETSFPNKKLIGRTAFYRHYYDDMEYFALAKQIGATPKNPMHVAILGGSSGMQAYSLLALAEKEGLHDCIHVSTLDLSPRFTAIARAGVYPKTTINRDSGFCFEFLEPADDGYVRVKDAFRKNVNVLPAGDIETFANHNIYPNVIALSNVLMYLESQERQSRVLQMASNHATQAVSVLWGRVDRLPYDFHYAGLAKDTGHHFEIDELHENFCNGRSVLAYKSAKPKHRRPL